MILKFVMIQLQSLFTGLNDQPSKTDVGLVVQESLPMRRQRCRKFMVSELSIGDISSVSDPVRKYRT